MAADSRPLPYRTADLLAFLEEGLDHIIKRMHLGISPEAVSFIGSDSLIPFLHFGWNCVVYGLVYCGSQLLQL